MTQLAEVARQPVGCLLHLFNQVESDQQRIAAPPAFIPSAAQPLNGRFWIADYLASAIAGG